MKAKVCLVLALTGLVLTAGAAPAGESVYRVRTLAAGGPGSLRDAVSRSRRTVIFDVAGEIRLDSQIPVLGSHLLVDGFSAPPPGITLRGGGLQIRGRRAHDVTVRGIRIRDLREGRDGIGVEWGAYDVLIDHVSVDGCGDGNLDITRNARDVTVSWSILSGCRKNVLVKYGARKVVFHHNLLIHSLWRNPWINYSDELRNNVSPDFTADVRNNIVWGWGRGGGTGVECGAKVNLVENVYGSSRGKRSDLDRAILLEPQCRVGVGGFAFTSGNRMMPPGRVDLNAIGNVPMPFPAPVKLTEDACEAARRILREAGARPLDAVDRKHLADVRLPDCPS